MTQLEGIASTSLPAASKEFQIADLPSIWSIATEMKWLVESLIPEASLIMLSGESGCGKSTFALCLADAVARGTTFLGHETTPRDVLIVDKENPAGVYRERLTRLRMGENPHLFIWGLWVDPEPDGPSSKAIVAFAKERTPLVIFDSLIAFHPGNEQDSSETRRYTQLFRKLTAVGATVLVIHHTGKGENTKQYRGSSDIKASFDVAFLLTSRSPDLVSLELTPFKSREGILEPVQMSLRGGILVSVADKQRELVENVIKEHPGIYINQLEQEARGVSHNKIREVLRIGQAKGWLLVTKGPNNSWCYTVREAVQ